MKAQEGIVLKDVPLCRDVYGTDWVAVGRVRKSAADERELLFYCVADNLLRGAAANAVKIAEGIFFVSDGLFARAAALSRFMTDTRRALHMIPEQSFREADTPALSAVAFFRRGMRKARTELRKRGVVFRLRQGKYRRFQMRA